MNPILAWLTAHVKNYSCGKVVKLSTISHLLQENINFVLEEQLKLVFFSDFVQKTAAEDDPFFLREIFDSSTQKCMQLVQLLIIVTVYKH